MAVRSSHLDAYEDALASPQPLLSLSEAFAEDVNVRGDDREEVLSALEDLASELRNSGREEDEDTVVAVMQFLVGWCSPHVRI